MNYIIDPMWFYWINVMKGLEVIFVLLIASSAVAVFVFGVWFFSNLEWPKDREFLMAKKGLMISIPILIVSFLAFIFVPSKETLIEMQVAKLATQDNAQWTVDAVKSAVDYIVEAIKGLK